MKRLCGRRGKLIYELSWRTGWVKSSPRVVAICSGELQRYTHIQNTVSIARASVDCKFVILLRLSPPPAPARLALEIRSDFAYTAACSAVRACAHMYKSTRNTTLLIKHVKKMREANLWYPPTVLQYYYLAWFQ